MRARSSLVERNSEFHDRKSRFRPSGAWLVSTGNRVSPNSYEKSPYFSNKYSPLFLQFLVLAAIDASMYFTLQIRRPVTGMIFLLLSSSLEKKKKKTLKQTYTTKRDKNTYQFTWHTLLKFRALMIV